MGGERLLELLKNNRGGFLSGPELSRRMGISRAAVWKQVRQLTALGYRIEILPRQGYCLKEVPDRLLAAEIRSGLGTECFGGNVYTYETVTSTNDIAAERAMGGAAEGTLVVAESQTAGRGRMGRRWMSPAQGGIYASVILRPNIAPQDTAKITLLAAVAVAEAIAALTRLPARIKWPNDILIDGKKVCGILTEMTADPDAVNFLIVGFGINVNTPVRSLPEHSASLRSLSGASVDRVAVLQAVLRRMERLYGESVSKRNFAAVLEQWRQLSVTLGQVVQVRTRGGVFRGRAVTIDDHGALILADSAGGEYQVMSGDVETVR